MNLLTFLQEHPYTFWAVLLLYGALVGSFLNVVIYRLPLMLQRQWRNECELIIASTQPPLNNNERFNLWAPRSRCPQCNHLIRAWHNIPVLSFLWLRGRCRDCKHPIKWRYPIIELIAALLTVYVGWHFGLTWQMPAALIFTWALLCLTMIDIDHQLLPDNITLPLMWLGIIVNFFGLFCTLEQAIIGAIAGYMSLWSVAMLFKIIKGKDGMGHGDFKLLAVIGAWLGWQALPLIIILASFSGVIIGSCCLYWQRKQHTVPIPFGPYLALAAFLALLWQEQLYAIYMQLIGW